MISISGFLQLVKFEERERNRRKREREDKKERERERNRREKLERERERRRGGKQGRWKEAGGRRRRVEKELLKPA